MTQDGYTQVKENTVRYVLCFNDAKIDKMRTANKKFVQRIFVRLDLVEAASQLTETGVWEIHMTSGRTIRVTGFAQGNPLERFVKTDQDKE